VVFRGGQLRGAWKPYFGNCDACWRCVVPEVDHQLGVASIDEAVRFAWDVLPERCMAMCNERLPFGLHDWAKYHL